VMTIAAFDKLSGLQAASIPGVALALVQSIELTLPAACHMVLFPALFGLRRLTAHRRPACVGQLSDRGFHFKHLFRLRQPHQAEQRFSGKISFASAQAISISRID
jgi:hypothetical protein